jgi:short-subunit dehydrogenase
MKRVLITGCSSGMGRTTALFLHKRGFEVYAASRTPKRLAPYSSETFHPFFMDIRDPESVKNAIAQIPTVDILVNNAGYGLVSTVEEVEEAQMLAQFDVNLFGLLRVTKAVIPKMREQKSGIIINISSFLGKIGLPLLTFYNASKYAVEGVTDSLRYELSPFGIRVHSIMPGFFDTNFARDNLVVNEKTSSSASAYADLVARLAPQIVEQINHGNDPLWIAKIITKIIEDENFPARVTAGEKASKFIPMKRELSDEDFERRVREYYNLG